VRENASAITSKSDNARDVFFIFLFPFGYFISQKDKKKAPLHEARGGGQNGITHPYLGISSFAQENLQILLFSNGAA
jgi:hypothetical protein